MEKTFKFNNNGITEEVSLERWGWVAVYKDRTELRQFDEETGTFHQFKEIDQSKLDMFKMVSKDKLPYTLMFDPNTMKLIHYYKTSVLENGQIKLRSYCFGYEKNINGVVVKTIATILPTDNLTLSDCGINLII